MPSSDNALALEAHFESGTERSDYREATEEALRFVDGTRVLNELPLFQPQYDPYIGKSVGEREGDELSCKILLERSSDALEKALGLTFADERGYLYDPVTGIEIPRVARVNVPVGQEFILMPDIHSLARRYMALQHVVDRQIQMLREAGVREPLVDPRTGQPLPEGPSLLKFQIMSASYRPVSPDIGPFTFSDGSRGSGVDRNADARVASVAADGPAVDDAGVSEDVGGGE